MILYKRFRGQEPTIDALLKRKWNQITYTLLYMQILKRLIYLLALLPMMLQNSCAEDDVNENICQRPMGTDQLL